MRDASARPILSAGFTRSTPTAVGRQTATVQSAQASPSVMLRYSRTDAVRVWGPVTGRRYDFSAAETVQPVDAGDAAALLRSGLFVRT